MRVGSLFSGIGGLDLGLHRAGWDHAFFCESDPYRRDVLRARWPGVPVYEDVRAVGEPAGRAAADGRGASVDVGGWEAGTGLLCGGFPCQGLSVAGQRRGLADERSILFFEFARIADALRPRWLLVENVPGLLSSNGGRDFGVVLGTLADLGYGVAWRILDSRFFGVPQRRRRVFIVGAESVGDPRAAAERAGEVLAVGSRCVRHSQTRGEAWPDAPVASLSGLGSGGPDDNDGQGGRLIANTMKSQRGKGGGGIGPEETLIAATLSHGSNPNSNMAGRRREDDENLVIQGGAQQDQFVSPDGVAPTLAHSSNTHQGHHQPKVFNWQTGGDMRLGYGDLPTALQKEQTPAVHLVGGVRRLTPTECERLQALPDGWTQLGDTADSKRYAALGDAVTASVAEWIGGRLAEGVAA